MERTVESAVMAMALVAYFGGVLTILSPCILPVLPFVFARAGQSFVRSGLPMLAGLAVTFTGVAILAAVGGGLAVAANQWGRAAALVVLALFGAALLFPALADRLMRPVVGLGARIAERDTGSPLSSVALGAATGLLWAPCAGPILGIVLTGAAIQGPNAETALLLFAYAAGAATSMAVALLAGSRILRAMRGMLGVGAWARRGLGAAVLVAVAVIAAGLDTTVLARLSTASTAALERGLIDRIRPPTVKDAEARPLASLAGPDDWLNSAPLTAEDLRGKVVLIDFWTYSCINCLRTLPYVRAWAEKYKDHGLVVIGVHTPEFAFERDLGNVRRAVETLGIRYPVMTDNAYRVWLAFENEYWPAHYFIDAMGRVRAHHFGEGDYEGSERTIQALLRETGARAVPDGFVDPNRSGVHAADAGTDRTRETYLGYEREARFASPEPIRRNQPTAYSAPDKLPADQWAFHGSWTVQGERSVAAAGGGITFRFRARDLHMVLGTDAGPVRFRVRLDGAAPGDDHGLDIDENGYGSLKEGRLYQLVRQTAPRERLFEIEFLDPGAIAYSFTFG